MGQRHRPQPDLPRRIPTHQKRLGQTIKQATTRPKNTHILGINPQLRQLRENTNPAEFTRDILRYQNILTGLAKTPTEQLLTKVEQARGKRKTKLTTGIKTHAA